MFKKSFINARVIKKRLEVESGSSFVTAGLAKNVVVVRIVELFHWKILLDAKSKKVKRRAAALPQNDGFGFTN